MPLNNLRKDVNICESCYKLLYYPSSQPGCEYDEVYIDVKHDERGNVIQGMSDDDIKHLAELEADPELPQNILSITEMQTRESMPDDLSEFNVAFLNTDTEGYTKSQLPSFFSNSRQPRAIKCRIGQKYFIKAIKPPMIRKIELYRLVSSSQKKTSQLICTVDYIDDFGTYEEGYFHPSILRFDQTLTTDTPTEVRYHESLINAHENKKYPIPLNMSDADLGAADFLKHGLFSCVSKTSMLQPQLPNMNSSVVNGNMLTRDFRIYHLGSLINDTTGYPDVTVLPPPSEKEVVEGNIYHYVGPESQYIPGKYYQCKVSEELKSFGTVVFEYGKASYRWIGGYKDGIPDEEHELPVSALTVAQQTAIKEYYRNITFYDGGLEYPPPPVRVAVTHDASNFYLNNAYGPWGGGLPYNNTWDTSPSSTVYIDNGDGKPSPTTDTLLTLPSLRFSGRVRMDELIKIYFNPQIEYYWDIVEVDDEVL
jgi:hypothetical protein